MTLQRNIFGAGSSSAPREVESDQSKAARRREDRRIRERQSNWTHEFSCMGCGVMIPVAKWELQLHESLRLDLRCLACDPAKGREAL